MQHCAQLDMAVDVAEGLQTVGRPGTYRPKPVDESEGIAGASIESPLTVNTLSVTQDQTQLCLGTITPSVCHGQADANVNAEAGDKHHWY